MTDEVKKEGKWEFDEEVTRVFSNMLQRSIPNYDTMRDLCFKVGRNFITDNGLVADIGCSNGLSSERFISEIKNCTYILSDVSEPMLEDCKRRYEQNGNVHVVYNDLRIGVPFNNADLCISCLTIQFTPIEYRQNIICSIYDNLRVGGALILVEKVIGNSAELDNTFIKEYYEIKKENGYTEELINSKRKSLEGVLVPLTSNFNEQMLSSAGFRKIDAFWRTLNFVAWIAIK